MSDYPHRRRGAVGPGGATAFESRVLVRLARGMTGPTVARELGITVKAVYGSVQAYRRRHRLASSWEAVRRFGRTMAGWEAYPAIDADEAWLLDQLVHNRTVHRVALDLAVSEATVYHRFRRYANRHRLGTMLGALVAWDRTTRAGQRIAS